jgi:hypothetical protein
MKNKHKLILGVLIVLFAASGFLFKEKITGYFVDGGEFDPIDPNELPDTINTELYSDVEAVETSPGSRDWALFQKYAVGKNQFCIEDCAAYCTVKDLEYYKAYVQSYGTCICKCLPAN